MKRQLKNKGFTLIEIVMVLVLLGILAAVAVPKYYDLQDEALNRAAEAIVADVQSQMHSSFAQGILDGQSCSDAQRQAIQVINDMKKNGQLSSNVTDLYTVTYQLPSGEDGLKLKFDLKGKKGFEGVLAIPRCHK